MKKLMMCLLVSVAASSAFADHSLSMAMDSNAKVKDAVEAAMAKKKVVCDTEHSMQMAAKIKGGGEAWRQVALCFSSQKDLDQATDTLTKGNQFGGLYGIPATAILDVTYSWSDNATPQDLVSLSLK
ncbi:MAG: hypothetical protein ACXVAX_06215 [Pseudobdellovibrio sp.]